MTKPNELLPCPVTDATEAVARAICFADGVGCGCADECRSDAFPPDDIFIRYAKAAIAALNTASTIPTDGEWVSDAAARILAEADGPPAVRSGSGTGIQHAAWMLEEIVAGLVSGRKAHRWLGYAQAILVEHNYLTLDEAKRAALSIQTISGKGMREAVKRAYIEGHNHGRANGPITYHSSEDWERSQSFAALVDQGERG